ncbi:hypothetical protein GJ496_010724 [Pomphorhynchus laevis]|nr:hypothetical protein GJ496_010724 [Pomphorhynchus laevis]
MKHHPLRDSLETELANFLHQISKNACTFCFIEEFVKGPPSQFPHFSEHFDTTDDCQLVEIKNRLGVELRDYFPSSSPASFVSPVLNILSRLSTWILLIVSSAEIFVEIEK